MSVSSTQESADYSAWVVVGCCVIALCFALGLGLYARSIDPSPLMSQAGLG